MGLHQSLIAEDRDTGDRMHALRMQKVCKFRHIADVDMLPAGQRMVEGNVDAAVAVLDIENYGIAPHFTPVLDNAYAVVASGHHAGQVNGADFEIVGDRDGLLDD